MTRAAWIALLAGLACSQAAVASPCSEQIEALSKRVKAEAAEAISASTGSKTVAAHREGEGTTGTGGSSASREAPPEKSAQAGEGSERAQQAKVALDEARTADSKGDAKGCQAALDRAKGQLQGAP